MISKPRLLSYSLITNNKSSKELIGAYSWNKHVSTSIYPILQCLEVTLRNELNRSISKHFNMSDWYTYLLRKGGDEKFSKKRAKESELENKFFRKNITPGKRGEREKWTSHHESMLNNARSVLLKEKKKCTPNAIVAELTFGFWVKLFEQTYRGKNEETTIWPHLEKKVFPNLASNERESSIIFNKLDELKNLRNRMSHHEPIWKTAKVKNKNEAIEYLNSIVDDATMIIYGISKSRYYHLEKSGHILKFRGLCKTETLDSFIQDTIYNKVDRRRLTREIVKLVNKNSTKPIIVNIKSTPTVIIDLHS